MQLEASGATHILFTNGLNDGWSAGGVTTTLSDEVISPKCAVL